MFFYKILAKYSPKRTKLHHFLKFSRGSMPPNPPNKRMALPLAAWREAPCKYPHFSKNILNPPRNEILDTPLHTYIYLQYTCMYVIWNCDYRNYILKYSYCCCFFHFNCTLLCVLCLLIQVAFAKSPFLCSYSGCYLVINYLKFVKLMFIIVK